MTHTTASFRRSRRFARGVVVVAALAAVGTVAGDPFAADTADAARRTKSAAIADAADRTIDSLDAWIDRQNPADYVRFVQGRERTATLTATDLELEAERMRTDWADAPIEKQRAVLAAMSQLGVPYESIASEPGVGFDCSGLTIWAFAEAGVEIPRVSGDQIDAAERIELSHAEPGDLVHYPGHIGIYLGAEAYVHSPEPGSHVEAVHLPDKSLAFGDAVAGSD